MRTCFKPRLRRREKWKLCAEFSTAEEVAIFDAQVLKQLRDVQGPTKPKVDENYGPQITEHRYECDSDGGLRW
ncbi:hypothetical protein FRC09_004791 [Ceratobasidium sp. 395]|nr:hypothetical protein FRC09_004791 [Ceratobasidium sp. 395]